MAVVLTVLEILGYALLITLVLLLIFLLIVLFSPFSYSFSGGIDDPEGSSEILHLNLKKDVTFNGSVRWLLGGVRASFLFDGEDHLDLVVLGVRIPLKKLMRKKKAKPKAKPEEEKKEEQKSIDEKIEQVLTKIEKIWIRVDDALTVLNTKYASRAKQTLLERLLPPVLGLLPDEWGLTGVVGLGDPARSAKVFSVQGLLYPVTAGHVAIGTEYDLYRYDLKGCARGSMRVSSFLYAGIRIILDKDVRHLIKRLRRGPAELRRNNGNGGNANGHKGHKAA